MTRNKHYVGGRSAATAATANHAAAQIWNPNANARIFLYEVWVCITTAGVANIGCKRSTARGTAGSTVTLGVDNSIERDMAPPSAFVLDLAAFTAQPTLAGVDLMRWNLPAAIGAGVILSFPDPITIPPATGIVITTPTAVVFPASDFTFSVGD
jgi:hypothetical protein